jgi:hypothetical protein
MGRFDGCATNQIQRGPFDCVCALGSFADPVREPALAASAEHRPPCANDHGNASCRIGRASHKYACCCPFGSPHASHPASARTTTESDASLGGETARNPASDYGPFDCENGPTGNASATGDEPLRTIYRECANAVIFCFAKQYAGLVSGFRRTCHQSTDALSSRRSSRGRLSGGRRRALRYPRRWNDRSRTLEADAKPPPERVTAGNAAQMAFFSRNARGTSRGESSGCACAFQCELDRY